MTVDRNITETYIDDVIESVNSDLAHLKAQGAIVSGRCYATPELIHYKYCKWESVF
jgi:phage tail sheath protein FI